MRTFVFFIGGSGARVLRSLTMLLAAGVRPSDGCREIIPLMIDYDKDNADLKRAESAVNNYRSIHRAIYGNHPAKEGFFSMPMSPASENSPIFVSMAADDNKFSDRIGYQDMDDLTKKFISSLYSDWQDPSGDVGLVDKNELYLDIGKGFKGNPNIGSAIFNEVFNLPTVKEYMSQIDGRDRVFIVGSIFGGTGSTGIPQIIQKIRSVDYEKLRNNIPIGMNLMLPYFKLDAGTDKGGNSTIDSNTFNSKTKAALDYYRSSINDSVQEIYYVGTNLGDTIDNHDGGTLQKNASHIVDVIAASSIIEYASRKKLSLVDPPSYYTFTSVGDDYHTLDLFNAADGSGDKYLYSMKAFGYFWKHYQTNVLPDANGKVRDAGEMGIFHSAKTYYQYFFKENTTDEFIRFKSLLEEFMFMRDSEKRNYDFTFESWIEELYQGAMKFRPYHLQTADSYRRFINIDENESHTRKNIIALYNKNHYQAEKSGKERNLSTTSQFMQMAYMSCMDIANEKNRK